MALTANLDTEVVVHGYNVTDVLQIMSMNNAIQLESHADLHIRLHMHAPYRHELTPTHPETHRGSVHVLPASLPACQPTYQRG